MIASAADVLSVHVTVPDRERALALARELVEQRLAACVNVLPGVSSVYRWEGAVQQDEECLLLVKTDRTRLQALEAAIVERHPDEVPCVLVSAVECGHAPYLQWLHAQVSPAPR